MLFDVEFTCCVLFCYDKLHKREHPETANNNNTDSDRQTEYRIEWEKKRWRKLKDELYICSLAVYLSASFFNFIVREEAGMSVSLRDSSSPKCDDDLFLCEISTRVEGECVYVNGLVDLKHNKTARNERRKKWAQITARPERRRESKKRAHFVQFREVAKSETSNIGEWFQVRPVPLPFRVIEIELVDVQIFTLHDDDRIHCWPKAAAAAAQLNYIAKISCLTIIFNSNWLLQPELLHSTQPRLAC